MEICLISLAIMCKIQLNFYSKTIEQNNESTAIMKKGLWNNKLDKKERKVSWLISHMRGRNIDILSEL